MDVDLVWVNRVGILLNFVAGFLMAPDLIGREYLARIEHALKRTLIRTRRFIRRPIASYESRHHISRDATPRHRRFIVGTGCWSMAIFFLFWLFWLDYLLQTAWSAPVVIASAVIGTILSALIVYKGAMAVAMSDAIWQDNSVGQAVAVFFFIIAEVALAILLGFAIGPAAILFYGLPRLLIWIIGLVMKKIRGNARFLKLLLVTGIACFVLGNLLQLWATRR